MAEEKTESKWEGKASADLKGPTADQVWPLLADFCSVHNWFPNLSDCHYVEGVQGQPGLVRYCATTELPAPSEGGDEPKVKWANEKLVLIDPIKRCLSYEVTENNFGLTSYVATMEVVPIDGGGGGGCKLVWSFVSDPVDGWKYEDLCNYVKFCVQFMGKKMEDHLQSS